jgi:N-acetylmuramic acid 6-phosphate etherase
MSQRTTERDSLYRHLETMDTENLLVNMNREDQKVALAVEKAIPAITALSEATASRMREGGR